MKIQNLIIPKLITPFKKSYLIILGIGVTSYFLMNTIKTHKTMKLSQKQRFIYSWGNGLSGQLGVGEEKDSQPVPKQTQWLQNSNSQLHSLNAAFDVSSCINEEGEIYVWGKTKDGALGSVPGGIVNISSPTMFVHLDQIDSRPIEVNFSKEHGVLVTKQGSLYSWGIDMYNKLGLKAVQTENKANKLPKSSYERIKFGKVELEEKIISSKCGYNHTICLSEDGDVYSWGYGKDGALGHGIYENVNFPKKVEYFSKNNIKIKKIECGDYFSLALSSDGILYSWGQNEFGQLGLGQLSQQLKTNIPKSLSIGNKKIKDIYAGEDHSACITEDGDAFIWGYGIDGRIGNNNKMNMNIPTQIKIDNFKVVKIACGGHHTAILTENGDLYMCGNGRDGELGRGDLLESQSVIRVQPLIVSHFKNHNQKVLDVACGSSHTIALIEQN